MRFTLPLGAAAWAAILLSAFALAACGGTDGSGGGGTGGQSLDPDVPPITEGAWYRPGVAATWAWQLQGDLNTSYDVEIYDIDLFDTDAADIAALQSAGHRVLCYFSAGSYEEWRPDAADFDPSDLGNTLSGFPDERWLNIRSSQVVQVMDDRLDLAVAKGCDGVEPDNVTGYEEDTGFGLTATDQLAFNRHLFNAAHERGLAVALKNDLGQIEELLDYVDLMVNEQCHELSECDALQPFVEAGKPVLNAEYLSAYRDAPEAVCAPALRANLRTLILSEELDDSFRFSCDDGFPSTTKLAGTETYVTYYQQDAAAIADLTELDLSVVQPVLTSDQIRSLQSHGKAVVYLSIGEIGLSNTYWYGAEWVLGQVIFDDHPEWFLDANPFFDSYFADAREAGWQDFIVEQAGLLLSQGYDGLFMDTVDTVDVYPETIPGMVALIALLRDAYPDATLVQNRGINVIGQTGPDVDALMFEVFNSYYNFDDMVYQATDVNAPGYSDLVDKALAYRLSGGVVLSQDFAEPTPAYEDLICYARDRALQHLFVPSYADKFFQDGLFAYPDACSWPIDPGFVVRFDPPVVNVSRGRTTVIELAVDAYLGYEGEVTLALGPPSAGVTATLGTTTVSSGQSTTLTLTAAESAAVGVPRLEVTASSEERAVSYSLPVAVHDETVWVANAGLSNVVAYDEPDQLAPPVVASRKSGGVVSQPYAVAVDAQGATWVVENVGDPDAAQPAGRILRYGPFDLSVPEATFDAGLNYPTGLAIDDGGRVWIANSALDWTGTPRGSASIVSIAAGASSVSTGFAFDTTALGYPRGLALDAAGNLWMTTTYGLVLGFSDPASASGTAAPFAVIVGIGGGADFLDTANNLVFDSDGDLWVSGRRASESRVIEVAAGSWATDGTVTVLSSADVPTVLTEGLFVPWGLAFGANGHLWVVNSTDATDDADSRGSLVRFHAAALTTGASPDRHIELDSRYTLGVAVARP